jgi:hypothetical protein
MNKKYFLLALSTLAISLNSCIHEQPESQPNTRLEHCNPELKGKLTTDHRHLNHDIFMTGQICSKSQEIDLIYEEDLAWY